MARGTPQAISPAVTIYPRKRSKSSHPVQRRVTREYAIRNRPSTWPAWPTRKLARGSVPSARMTFDERVPDACSTFDDDDDTTVTDIRPMLQDPPVLASIASVSRGSVAPLPAASARRARKETIRRGIYIDTVDRNGQVVRELFGSPLIECPGCGALAVCRMPPVLASLQEDGTEFACLPHHGGCGGGLKTRTDTDPSCP